MSLFEEAVQEGTGEDWQYIKHIPEIEVHYYEEKTLRFSGK